MTNMTMMPKQMIMIVTIWVHTRRWPLANAQNKLCLGFVLGMAFSLELSSRG